MYSARLLMTQDRTASRPSGTVTFRMDSENCGAAFVTAKEVTLPSASITVLVKLRGWRDDNNASPVLIKNTIIEAI